MKKKIVIIALLIALLAAGGTLAYRKFFTTPETRVLETGRVSGGAIGIAAGFLMSLAIARILSYPASVSASGLLTAFAASVASGVLAGIYPSLKATKIHPVDIIRS